MSAHPPSVLGFEAGATACGLKKHESLDLCVITSDRPCTAAAVFTQNRIKGEPVKLDRKHLRHSWHRAIVVNSKYSNVCTGRQGFADARAMAEQVGAALGCKPETVFVASTGIIGARMPMDKVQRGIDQALEVRQPGGWGAAAEAIMTTDTRPKLVTRAFSLGKKRAHLLGIAKGSGMIEPHMGTMLAFFVTDVAVEKRYLQKILRRVADQTFNRVTIDGDTSTSDSVIVLANGAAGNRPLKEGTPLGKVFESNLLMGCATLAREIARDGEGARHLITIQADGAQNERDAERLARSVANSPLVKTAIYGQDANVGRLAMAAGKAGVAFAQEQLQISVNGHCVMRGGFFVPFDEPALTQTLAAEETEIHIRIGDGPGKATIWTCDLTEDYIHINADYRS